ncbi:hypothetical protein AB0J80_04160 [Actinoplanes sp. NPDC049548]|uniref:hypothetical protein n=1 Tax=Actinoplanes sp. NPDC049548 TaxID=3155152 RepID=UPI0034226CBF
MTHSTKRLGVSVLAMLLACVTALFPAAGPAQAASCVSGYTADNLPTTLQVMVHYQDCSNGTWLITSIDVYSQYTRYNATVVIRRYAEDGTVPVSWQKSLGQLGAGVFYGDVSDGKSFSYNKAYNPYVYVHYRNTTTGPYLDSPVARLPWIG